MISRHLWWYIAMLMKGYFKFLHAWLSTNKVTIYYTHKQSYKHQDFTKQDFCKHPIDSSSLPWNISSKIFMVSTFSGVKV